MKDLLDLLEIRRAVRKAAAASRNNLPVVLSESPGTPPKEVGDPWHFRTLGGTVIQYPSAYSKIGWSNMTYCPSTLRVVVGEEWLRTWLDQPENSELKSKIVFTITRR